MLDLTISKRVAWITLSRPPVNALNDQLIAQFHVLLDQLDLRDDWGVLAIVSNQKVFCAGADLAQIEECINTPEGADRMVEIISQFQSLFLRIETLNATTIAVISGAALGGGLELSLPHSLYLSLNSGGTLTHSLTHSLSHSLIEFRRNSHSLTHSLTHSPTLSLNSGGTTLEARKR